MTLDELAGLPETGGFEVVSEVRDGKNISFARERPAFALWTDESEPCMFTDADGSRWMVGWHDGKRYKSRLSH